MSEFEKGVKFSLEALGPIVKEEPWLYENCTECDVKHLPQTKARYLVKKTEGGFVRALCEDHFLKNKPLLDKEWEVLQKR